MIIWNQNYYQLIQNKKMQFNIGMELQVNELLNHESNYFLYEGHMYLYLFKYFFNSFNISSIVLLSSLKKKGLVFR